MKKNILVITGEPSGDQRCGELIKELKKLKPDLKFWGIGGDTMASEGVHLVEHVRNLSLVGLSGVIKNLGKIRKQYKDLTANIKRNKPDLAILVDYPGFNLRVAKFLHENNIPVVYYVIPQVWVWGKNRIELLRKYTDKLLVLFDFEKKFLEENGLMSVFVGHPLIDRAPEVEKRSDNGLTIALLPGSRKNEITGLLPVMMESAEKIYSLTGNKPHFIVAESSNIDKYLYDRIISRYPSLPVKRIRNRTFEVLNMSDFAIVTSGTATLETAVMETPMVVTYKGSFLAYILFLIIIGRRFLGLVNIIAEKEIAPELMQYDATAEKISAKVMEMISNEKLLSETKDSLRKVKASLGEKGAAKRAAEAVAEMI